jgi:hypothetical protein
MLYKDACHRCGGTGTFQWFSMGQIAEGTCFACLGRGHKVFKTSPEERAKNRAKAQAKREAKLAVINAEREDRAIEAANRGHYTLYLYSLARASREAVKPPKAPVPAGRVEVTGTVISTREEWSQYGTQFKALIEDDRGFRLWGNLPSAIYRAEKGDRVTFVAGLTASRDDEFFGFWKRPTKAAYLDQQEAA